MLNGALSLPFPQRVANFSLDTALREACASDLKNRCQHSLAEIDKDEHVRDAALKCLQTYKEELESEQCKSEVSVVAARLCICTCSFILHQCRVG